MKVLVRQTIGIDCLTVQDGWRLYRHFMPEVRAGRQVVLDFAGVQALGAPFFNASLGFLLRDFEPQELGWLVMVLHLDPAAMKVLRRVLRNCRRHYQEMQMKPVPPPQNSMAGEGVQYGPT